MKKRPTEDARLQAFMEVWAGRRTATEAARTLGISRKTYYEWEGRALEGLRQALQRGEPGRPGKSPDPEKARLEEENRQLRAQLEVLQQRDQIRRALVEAGAQKK